MRTIIVEDEIMIRKGIEKLLSKISGVELVGQAESGEEGLELLRTLKPDVVITDIRMAGMDGLEMLQSMTALGIGAKAIVLSAYSEFEYARKAMKLGVTEYLLKPISYMDLVQAINNVKEQVEAAKRKKPEQFGTIEQIFQILLEEGLSANEETRVYLQNNYQIGEKQKFLIACAYLGSRYEASCDMLKTSYQYAISAYENLSYAIIKSPYRKSLIIIMYHYHNAHDLERWLQRQLISHSVEKVPIGIIETEGVDHIKDSFETLYPYMDWTISLDDDILISYPKITKVQTVSCIYPIELETKVRVALCSFDWEKVRMGISEFFQYFRDGKIYVPKEIKECYVRFLWMMIGLGKELGSFKGQELDQQLLLTKIMGAKTQDDLIDATMEFYNILKPQKQEDTTHLTIKRLLSIVHEFYQTGITLDEIGNRLNMTPEYLGTLFHKEMGISFSAYMKEYRIGKAKELLCTTQMKLYEIAERVGYSDPKYFSKVFKEATGQLPNEFRKTYR